VELREIDDGSLGARQPHGAAVNLPAESWTTLLWHGEIAWARRTRDVGPGARLQGITQGTTWRL
jgi:hypothetical protein